MLSFALANAGFDTVTAVDSGEAQTALNQRLPDLILLDWMLPGLSGVADCAEVFHHLGDQAAQRSTESVIQFSVAAGNRNSSIHI